MSVVVCCAYVSVNLRPKIRSTPCVRVLIQNYNYFYLQRRRCSLARSTAKSYKGPTRASTGDRLTRLCVTCKHYATHRRARNGISAPSTMRLVYNQRANSSTSTKHWAFKLQTGTLLASTSLFDPSPLWCK